MDISYWYGLWKDGNSVWGSLDKNLDINCKMTNLDMDSKYESKVCEIETKSGNGSLRPVGRISF